MQPAGRQTKGTTSAPRCRYSLISPCYTVGLDAVALDTPMTTIADEVIDEPPRPLAPLRHRGVGSLTVRHIGIGVDICFVAADVDELVVEEVMVTMDLAGVGVRLNVRIRCEAG